MQGIVVTNQLNPKTALETLSKDAIQYIVVHHAAADSCTWTDINAWHKNNGWACAGYNSFVTKTGEVYILRGYHVGAQTLGYNAKSWGICLEGNYDTSKISALQLNALINHIIDVKNDIGKSVTVLGHRDLLRTTCPGKNIDMVRVSTLISAYNSINILKKHGVISSPEYWQLAITDDAKAVNKDYLAALVQNMGAKLNG